MVLPTEAQSVGIGDWEMTRGSGRIRLEEVILYPQGAQQLLDRLSPYLAPVTEALAPLLAAHGLSRADATVDVLLATDGLADELISAATVAIARVDAVGLHPLEVQGTRVASGELPAGWPLNQPHPGVTLQPFKAEPPPLASSSGGLPSGWALHVVRGPRHLKIDENGDPCYPDIPTFEEYWPKCPVPEPESEPSDVPCTEDSRFLRADARLRELRDLDRLPSSFRGFDYREHLAQSVALPIDELYRCGDNPSSPNTMASWYGPPGPAVIRLYERFLDLEPEWDLLGVITGPVNFRAAILLHEHVHRIEDPEQGTVSAPSDRDYHPAGSSGQDDCPWSGTEYDAAYLQTLYLGGSEAVARMVADLYGRKQCGQLSRSAQLLAAAGDIIEALTLGWFASVEVIATLAARINNDDAIELIAELFPADIAALIVVVLV